MSIDRVRGPLGGENKKLKTASNRSRLLLLPKRQIWAKQTTTIKVKCAYAGIEKFEDGANIAGEYGRKEGYGKKTREERGKAVRRRGKRKFRERGEKRKGREEGEVLKGV